MRYFIPLIFAATLMSHAQVVSLGLKAGVPLTGALPSYLNNSSSIIDTGRWTVGPTVEVHLPHHFSIEVDALYRGYRFLSAYGFSAVVISAGPSSPGVPVNTIPFFYSTKQDTRAWDIPVLLKHRFTVGRLRPFALAGITSTHESSDFTTTANCLGSDDQCASAQGYRLLGSNQTYSRWHGDGTVGVGVEARYGKIRLAPEVRYTRIGRGSVRNQATFLVGLTF